LIEDGAYQVDLEVRRYLRDVHDHTLRVTEQVMGFREILQNILSVNLTLVGLSQNEEVNRLTQASIRQNEEVKRISAWAAILFAPTLIGTVYGMNFDYMPELHWVFGYPFAVLLMVLVSASLYVVFKRRDWL
jgi:magnesium transporter